MSVSLVDSDRFVRRRWSDVFESDGEDLGADECSWLRYDKCQQPGHATFEGYAGSNLNASAVEFVPMPGSYDTPGASLCSPSLQAGAGPSNTTTVTETEVHASENEWVHRCQRRQQEIDVLMARLVKHRFCMTEEHAPPNPNDKSIGRRQWKRGVDVWFKAALQFCLEEKPVSLASTAEASPSSRLDSWTTSSPSSASDCTSVADLVDADAISVPEEQAVASCSAQVGMVPLRATAPEFLPTQTMYCALVTVHGRIAAPSDVSCAAVPQSLLECLPQANLESPAEVTCLQATDEEWQQKSAHRRKELSVLSDRLAARGLSPEEAALVAIMPNPTNRLISRRQWKRDVDTWFNACLLRCPQGKAVTDVSTEEHVAAVDCLNVSD